ncbi:hypothetical protein BLA29_005019 [Euroglyphus maynei]|uniref:Uncharacterized protein n=1 Tax=Euroglyphus maynei TaxID=6958 RepID=A0A1Y3ARW1_EURMA|nr:hypothetical protein BLA29_005019 [Euroglyphus maynei]
MIIVITFKQVSTPNNSNGTGALNNRKHQVSISQTSPTTDSGNIFVKSGSNLVVNSVHTRSLHGFFVGEKNFKIQNFKNFKKITFDVFYPDSFG